VTLEFLSPLAAGAPPARSPMERDARAAGARFEVRDGWNVAVAYPGARRGPVGWADMSHLPKFELQGPATSGHPLTADRRLVLGRLEGAGDGASVVDVTTTFAALRVLGPLAREALARLTALDLRLAVAPPGSFRPGSVARVPGMVLCEAPDRFLVLFGAALGHYMWTAVADAAGHLGGGPVGADA
jgi:glycine cleavage system aminomethyltransferase T